MLMFSSSPGDSCTLHHFSFIQIFVFVFVFSERGVKKVQKVCLGQILLRQGVRLRRVKHKVEWLEAFLGHLALMQALRLGSTKPLKTLVDTRQY